MKNEVLLVNLPTERGKRSHFGLLPFQKGTNYGLLSIASYLFERGHSAQIFDAQNSNSPERAMMDFAQLLNNREWLVIGFSCISGFSYPLLNSWANVAKALCPTAYVVVGGKDHVGRIPKITLKENASVDAVISGEGEIALEHVVVLLKRRQSIANDGSIHTRSANNAVSIERQLTRIPSLEYRLYPNFKEFPASVEFGRGCPFACGFCVSANTGFRYRSPTELASEIERVQAAYNVKPLPIYLEAPIFLARTKYLQRLEVELRARSIKPIWRAEARVDSLELAQVPLLYHCGMRVVDLGLESASPAMLLLMRKTKRPQEYLTATSHLLQSLSQHKVFAKVNILFYPGETRETLDETLRFLRHHKKFIGAVAAYPMMLYPGIEHNDIIKLSIKQAGGSLVNDPAWKRRHLVPVNPSESLTYRHLIEEAHSWEQEFQTDEEYFYQRKFGYFGPQTDYDQFRQSIAQLDAGCFPFRINSARNAGR